jgi:hypothetical protein
MLGNIIGGFVIILVGTTLAPTIASNVAGAIYSNLTTKEISANMTNGSATILNLSVLFYNLSVASVAIGMAAQGLKNAGLM